MICYSGFDVPVVGNELVKTSRFYLLEKKRKMKKCVAYLFSFLGFSLEKQTIDVRISGGESNGSRTVGYADGQRRLGQRIGFQRQQYTFGQRTKLVGLRITSAAAAAAAAARRRGGHD
jgi:hypothetical protein